MKNLADPLLFNGVAKGVVIMYVFYHYKTAKIMSSDRLKHALSSLIDFDTIENMQKFKEMKSLYSVDIDLMNACIKYSAYILHLLIEDFGEDDYLQGILEDHGVIFDDDKTLNQYLLAWMHVVLLGMLGVKARVIVPFKFDMFDMDKVFKVKRYESKAYKEKWSGKSTKTGKKKKNKKKGGKKRKAEESYSEGSDDEDDAMEVEFKESTDVMDCENFGAIQFKDRKCMLAKEEKNQRKNANKKTSKKSKKAQNKVSAMEEKFFPSHLNFLQTLEDYSAEPEEKLTKYFIEVLDQKSREWVLVNTSTCTVVPKPGTFYEDHLIGTNLLGVYSIQPFETREGCVRMKDITLLCVPHLIRSVIQNRNKISPAIVYYDKIVKALLFRNENLFFNMTEDERKAELKEELKERALEREFYLSNKADLHRASFYTRKADVWNYIRKWAPNKRKAWLKLGNKGQFIITVCLKSESIMLHTDVAWRSLGRQVAKGKLPIKARVLEKRTGQKVIKYYPYFQTEALEITLTDEGKIPKNEYGNFETMYGLPKGTTYVPIKGIKKACKDLGVDFAEAVVEFDYTGGFPKPVIVGVVAHDKDVVRLIKQHKLNKKKAKERLVERESKMMQKHWKSVFSSLYIKFYFQNNN